MAERRMRNRLATASFCALLAGCGGDESGGGAGGSGGTGGSNEGGTQTGDCSTVIMPSTDDSETVQTALIEASAGDTICLSPGTYSFTKELSLANILNVTLKGTGTMPDDVVLDFARQISGDDGVTVTADGFTIENVWIKNTKGNGIVVRADDSHFDRIKVTWDAGSITENGNYGIYPTNCNRTLIENSEASGASDAGIYVGQCRGAIVRNNKVYGNVLGIEIENTIEGDIYENDVYDNTAGVLVDLLPNKDVITENSRVLVRDNNVHENNRENFGEPGEIFSVMPPGTGLMVLAASTTEVRNNTFSGLDGPGVIVISYDLIEILLNSTTVDPNTDRYPDRIHVHDNTFSNNGATPRGAYGVIGLSEVEDVLWDGILGPDTPDAATVLCLGTAESASFRNLGFGTSTGTADGGVTGDAGTAQSTDPTPHQCTFEALPVLEF